MSYSVRFITVYMPLSRRVRPMLFLSPLGSQTIIIILIKELILITEHTSLYEIHDIPHATL